MNLGNYFKHKTPIICSLVICVGDSCRSDPGQEFTGVSSSSLIWCFLRWLPAKCRSSGKKSKRGKIHWFLFLQESFPAIKLAMYTALCVSVCVVSWLSCCTFQCGVKPVVIPIMHCFPAPRYPQIPWFNHTKARRKHKLNLTICNLTPQLLTLDHPSAKTQT